MNVIRFRKAQRSRYYRRIVRRINLYSMLPSFTRKRTHWKSRAKNPLSYALLIAFICLFIWADKNSTHIDTAPEYSQTIDCFSPTIIDGDTLSCNGVRIRLAGIDTPEMPGHCRVGRDCVSGDPYAAKDYLYEITRGSITCHPIEKDRYGRTVAQCESEDEDLSCAMIDSEHAVPRYGSISCG